MKKYFLYEVKKDQSNGFLEDAWDLYNYRQNPREYCGSNGCEFCSDSYLTQMQGRLFPMSMVSAYLQADYAQAIKDELQQVMQQMSADVNSAQAENDYITEENVDHLKWAVAELERCGVMGGFSLVNQIQALCWYTPLDQSKIRALQRNLNSLGFGSGLQEDGVYGKKTQSAWMDFLSALEHGAVPTLAWIDPLQSDITRVEIHSSDSGINNVLRNADYRFQYFRVDPPHLKTDGNYRPGTYRGKNTVIDYNHINFDKKLEQVSKLYMKIAKEYDHQKIPDEAYRVLKNLKETGKVVRIAGKVLLVAGIALDTLELGTSMHADLNDADGKLGKITMSTVASIGGRWAGAAVGSQAGALAGATIGTAVLPGVGTLVGGAVLGLIGGFAGSLGGGALGEWVVDITYVED